MSRQIGGLRITLLNDNMTRSVAVKAKSAHDAYNLVKKWEEDPLPEGTADAYTVACA